MAEKSPTWRVVAEWLVIILIGVGGYFLAEVRADITKKVDKEQYYRDIEDIKGGIERLVTMHLKRG